MPVIYTPTVDQILAALSNKIDNLQAALNNKFIFEGRFDDNLPHNLVSGSGIGYTTIDDPVGGWDAANNWWVVPFAGRYKISTAIKANVSGWPGGGGCIIQHNGGNIYVGPNSGSGVAFSGSYIINRVLRCAQGDTIRADTTVNLTTQNDGLGVSNTYLTIEYYSP